MDLVTWLGVVAAGGFFAFLGYQFWKGRRSKQGTANVAGGGGAHTQPNKQ